jgi:bacillithiol biosynthesis cysteine-adding enzyme BshC
VIETISPSLMPSATGNRLYLDYLSGEGVARSFYTWAPDDLGRAAEARLREGYPREAVTPMLSAYNARMGASARTLENVAALGEPTTGCVITGQQVGFLGGPAYTAYKIMTTIRLAQHLAALTGVRMVPVFWLASEDHDFREINHTFVVKRDGEIGRVAFDWAEEGRSVSHLPITPRVERALSEYWDLVGSSPYVAQVREILDPRSGEDYTAWHSRVWLQVFGAYGLVVVEPRTLRPAAGAFFASLLQQSTTLHDLLEETAKELRDAGYEPLLTSEASGQMYTYEEGNRIRVDNTAQHIDAARAHPERYSTDAALRPIFADAMLPIVASVLGPGETAYQAQLRPLYALLGVAQPLLFPRKSYTIVSEKEQMRLAAYGTSVRELLTGKMDGDALFRNLLPREELELFAQAQQGMANALAPLRAYMEEIDPSLGKTWAQTLARADQGLGRLRERAFRARMSQLGYSKGELRQLSNALLPRGRLQERVLSWTHLSLTYGPGLLDQLSVAGDLLDWDHTVLTVEDVGERCGGEGFGG